MFITVNDCISAVVPCGLPYDASLMTLLERADSSSLECRCCAGPVRHHTSLGGLTSTICPAAAASLHRAPSSALHQQRSFSVAALRRRAWEHAEAIAAEAAAAAIRRHQLQVIGAAAAAAAVAAASAGDNTQVCHSASPPHPANTLTI